MDVWVFGGLRASARREGIDLGRPKQRLLFAILAIEAGRVVPAARLGDLLWPDGTGKTRAALHAYVSHLRKVLEPVPGDPATVLVHDTGGYRLAIGRDHVDALRFESLVEQGHRAGA